MRILVTGANGFMGAEIVKVLLQAGHEVVACTRKVQALKSLFPQLTPIFCDFLRDTAPRAWLARLHNIDAVINCVGVLQTWRTQTI